MRDIEEIKKEQQQAIFNTGFHLIQAEQWKIKTLEIAKELDAAIVIANLKEKEAANKIEEEVKEKAE